MRGGQHLAGVGNVINNQQVTNLFVAANRNPRMGDMYSKLLNNWHAAGAGLFVNYTNVGQYGRYGSWGVPAPPYCRVTPVINDRVG
jgi:hypothetical protein